MKNILIVFVIILLINTYIFADNTEAFLNFFPTSFGEAMAGNINGAVNNNYTGLFYYNPSNGYIDGKWAAVYEHKFLLNTLSHYNSTFFMFSFNKELYCGLGYINQSITDIPIFPEFPLYADSVDFTSLGDFSDNANLFLFNINYHYKPDIYKFYSFSGGINIKYIYHKIYEYRGIGTAFDLGFNCNIEFEKLRYSLKGKLGVFFTLKDIGDLIMKWNTPNLTSNKRDMSFSTGINYTHQIKSFDMYYEININKTERIEYGISFMLNYDKMLGLFTGLKYYKNFDGYYSIKKPGIGIVMNVMNIQIMYAISKYDLGLNHSISAGISL